MDDKFVTLLCVVVLGTSLVSQGLSLPFIYGLKKRGLANSGNLPSLFGAISALQVIVMAVSICVYQPQMIGVMILGGSALVIACCVGSFLITTFFVSIICSQLLSGRSKYFKLALAVELVAILFIAFPFAVRKFQDARLQEMKARMESGRIPMDHPGVKLRELKETVRIKSFRSTKSQVAVIFEDGSSDCFELHNSHEWHWTKCEPQTSVYDLPEVSDQTELNLAIGLTGADREQFRIIRTLVRTHDAFAVVEKLSSPGKFQLMSYSKTGEESFTLSSDAVDIALPTAEGMYGSGQINLGIPKGIDSKCFRAALSSSFLILSTCSGLYVAYEEEKK